MLIVGNGFGFWKTIPTRRRTSTDRSPAIDVLAVEEHFAFGARAGDDLVHAVQASEERRFAAPRRSDERRHAAFDDRKRHAFDRSELP